MPAAAAPAPSERVELLAGTPPGGGQDRAARALAAAMARFCDERLEVVNLPGRGGSTAWESLASTPGDARRLAVGSPTLLSNAIAGVSPLDHRGLTPLGGLCTESIVFAVRAGSVLSDPSRLVEALGRPPGPLVAIATAARNTNHLAVAAVAAFAGLDPGRLRLRVHPSAPLAARDVAEGEAEVVAVSAAGIVPLVEEGALRPVAASGAGSLSGPLAGTPTWEELGVPCAFGTWRVLLAPPRLGHLARRHWEVLAGKALATREWREALTSNHWVPLHLGPAALFAFLEDEREAIGQALRFLGAGDGDGDGDG